MKSQIQCRMLGMAIESFTPCGTTTAPGDTGELVCLKPFPCMPVGFWPLPGFGTDEAVSTAKERYKQAYFAEYDGVWCKPCLNSARKLLSQTRKQITAIIYA